MNHLQSLRSMTTVVADTGDIDAIERTVVPEPSVALLCSLGLALLCLHGRRG